MKDLNRQRRDQTRRKSWKRIRRQRGTLVVYKCRKLQQHQCCKLVRPQCYQTFYVRNLRLYVIS
jgi:hypothetical protein